MSADQRLQNVSATENYRRSVLRAPAAGVIDSLAYTTIGGVVPPGQTILQIVSDRGILTVDARISPADVDQLHAGQDAKVNFSAFNRQTKSEEHTSELQSLMRTSYAVFCLKKKNSQTHLND